MTNQPVIKKRSGISPVWTLPVLAIGLCAWLLYRSFMEAGIEIEIYFDDASGITPGKTQVMTKGIPLGIVTGMHPALEKNKVRITLKMDRSTEGYLVEDAKFWLVKPEISANRITGLETILSGSYIAAQKGKSMTPSRVFMALSTAPPIPSDTPGLHIKLISNALRSIQEGSSIYFKNIKIGSVKTYSLEEDDSVRIESFIEPEYTHLVHSGSRFYDASGFTLTGKIPEIKFRMESISSLFIGGIVVGTPPELSDTPLAQNGDRFTLYEDFASAGYGIPMTLKLASGAGISEGTTKVMYRGLEAGYVKHITINDDPRRTVSAHILLDPRAEIILREKTSFWLVKPELSLDGAKNLNTLLTGPSFTFQAGDGAFKDEFELLAEPPAEPPLRPGKSYLLTSMENPSCNAGAPVYYRKKKIGEVIGSEFSPDGKSVETAVFIYDEFIKFIESDVVFIEKQPLSIDASLAGLSVSVSPLVSTLKGGIDVINVRPSGEKAASHQPFTLYRDYRAALEKEPGLMPEGIIVQLTTEDLDPYQPGAPILYKKIKVGQVLGFSFSEKDKRVYLSCIIEKRYQDLVSTTSLFFKASGIKIRGDVRGIAVETESLQSVLTGGIAFLTPAGGKKVENNHLFNVFDSLETAKAADNLIISVHFNQDRMLLSSGAKVEYRGIQLGTVKAVKFDDNLETIIADLSVERRYVDLFRDSTKIWLTTPTINLNRIQHLDNVIFGSTVAILPGTGAPRTNFDGLDNPPQQMQIAPDMFQITLEAKHLGSLDIGSPVYYRQVKVGEVAGYDLSFDFTGVLIYVVIESRYAPIVRENTRFWNASGISVHGGIFSGVSVTTQSMEALLSGGIALATPGKDTMGAAVASGHRFVLSDKAESNWLDWSPEIFAVEKETGDIKK